VLDEPTNDLDVETLDLLQDTLGAYDGTVLLVSMTAISSTGWRR
jgi:ATP-binding cassette subfamily F protein uup